MKIRKTLAYLIFGYSLSVISMPANAFSWASVFQLIKTMQSEAGAWAVSVKQSAVAANQQSMAELTSKKQLATAIGSIAMSNNVMRAVVSFDSEVGQPITIKCEAQQNGKLFVEAEAQRDKDASHLMASFSSHRVGSRAVADTDQLNMHRDLYCSVSEAKQGMCSLTPNGMQAWDVNYSGAFGERTLAPEGETAAFAYAAMVSDTRAEAQVHCKSTACAAAQSSQLATAAMGAMVANSFVGQVTARRVPMLTGN